jgi:hypothetical protein
LDRSTQSHRMDRSRLPVVVGSVSLGWADPSLTTGGLIGPPVLREWADPSDYWWWDRSTRIPRMGGSRLPLVVGSIHLIIVLGEDAQIAPFIK